MIQGVKTNRLSGHEVHILRVGVDSGGDVYEITTNYYRFTGRAVNGKPREGVVTFLDTETNRERNFIDF